ncbi:SDR family oxidoreductase [Desulfonatronum sp. SC1]|uniref:SDR family oxidoreductase n=1 Tax=Desulfonatronum sp. SC1 TaxID=2109626 RepID=UPI000D2FDDF1|nr:SDR family oxidoreductase [Desulfonatronum sp. SC1]PTN33198.1 short-chain dehydrogenase [Desulfonatronum sp. SC1]
MLNILVIGATSAIATACARQWAGQQATFFLVGRDQAKLQAVADDLLVRGATAVTSHTLDMNHFADHPVLLDAAFAAMSSVDVALVAHGTLPDQQACEQDVNLTLEEVSTNGLSVIALLTLLANRMQPQGSGTIAVISSVAGDRGRPTNYVYGTAKAAVTTFCEGLRARLSKFGVHVLTIKPGFVDTPMTESLDLPRILVATPERVARRIVRGVARRRNVLYVPAFWALILWIIRSIPQPIFKRLNL